MYKIRFNVLWMSWKIYQSRGGSDTSTIEIKCLSLSRTRIKTILVSVALDAKENILTCSHVAILWCRPIASGLCSSTFPIVHLTSYTPLLSGCCSTLMHALFRRCIHSLFMSWSIDVNRPRSVSEHVAMAESESGGQRNICHRSDPFKRTLRIGRCNEFTVPYIQSVTWQIINLFVMIDYDRIDTHLRNLLSMAQLYLST